MDGNTKLEEWSSQKLQQVVEDRITDLFERVLDYAEIAVLEEKRYKVFRSKILRVSNDAIRFLKQDIERDFTIKSNKIGQDIVKVRQGRKEV